MDRVPDGLALRLAAARSAQHLPDRGTDLRTRRYRTQT